MEISCIRMEKITKSTIEKLYNMPIITLPVNHETPKIVLKIPYAEPRLSTVDITATADLIIDS